jgi:hypothetical protein
MKTVLLIIIVILAMVYGHMCGYRTAKEERGE